MSLALHDICFTLNVFTFTCINDCNFSHFLRCLLSLYIYFSLLPLFLLLLLFCLEKTGEMVITFTFCFYLISFIFFVITLNLKLCAYNVYTSTLQYSQTWVCVIIYHAESNLKFVMVFLLINIMLKIVADKSF